MKDYEKLLLANKAWASEMRELNPNFFNNLAKAQTPKFLWIGCSDSRVPANQITGTDPGEIFVHRNVANMVVHTDLNMLSVLQYAVEVLKVEHIMVVGHYGCGGVKASLEHTHLGLINKWLRNIKEVYRIHKSEIDLDDDLDNRADRLVEFNIKEQVDNLMKTSIIQRAWQNHQRPMLHGWVYGMDKGEIKELVRLDYTHPIEDVFRFTFDAEL